MREPDWSHHSNWPSLSLKGEITFPEGFPEEEKELAIVNLELVYQQTDRGIAIVSAAYLESVLESLLKSALTDSQVKVSKTESSLFERLFSLGNPPLGTFSSQIDLSLSLNLIEEDNVVSRTPAIGPCVAAIVNCSCLCRGRGRLTCPQPY